LDPAATFTSFGSATINNAGQVAFAAFANDGRRGFYVAKPGEAPAKVVASGDPGPGGSTFPTTMPTAFGFNDRGEVAFMTTVVGGPGGGAFVGTAGGPLVAVAVNGDPAPSGGSFAITATQPSIHMNNTGDVVFRTGLTGGTADSGLFLIRRAEGAARTIALQGQPAPGTGSTFSTLQAALNNIPGENATLTSSGEVWTSQSVLLSTGGTTVVHFRFGIDNTLEKMFGRGDVVPGNAGTIVRTIQVEPTGVDASGAYCFWAGLMGGRTSEAIFVTK
jgi:hypothetical protein